MLWDCQPLHTQLFEIHLSGDDALAQTGPSSSLQDVHGDGGDGDSEDENGEDNDEEDP